MPRGLCHKSIPLRTGTPSASLSLAVTERPLIGGPSQSAAVVRFPAGGFSSAVHWRAAISSRARRFASISPEIWGTPGGKIRDVELRSRRADSWGDLTALLDSVGNSCFPARVSGIFRLAALPARANAPALWFSVRLPAPSAILDTAPTSDTAPHLSRGT